MLFLRLKDFFEYLGDSNHEKIDFIGRDTFFFTIVIIFLCEHKNQMMKDYHIVDFRQDSVYGTKEFLPGCKEN